MMRRSVAAIAVATVLALGAPQTASAALLWTLVATPTGVPTGIDATFTLTATNGDLLTEIGCVIVDVPANFTITGVGVVGSTAGDSWIAWRSGNRVTAQTTSGGDRLELLDSVTFTVRATALSGGSIAWGANAFRQQDCSGGGSLIGVPPVVLVTGPAVTPTPAPTAPPTPAPTAVPTGVPTAPPTPVPTSTPVTSTPRPVRSNTPPPSSVPSTAVPASVVPSTESLAATSTPQSAPAQSVPSSSSVPAAGSIGGTDVSPPPSTGSDRAAASPPPLRVEEERVELANASIGLLAGVSTWAVPAATIAGPGLLVLLWVAIQAAGAIAWVPAARRLRGVTGRRNPAR